MSVKSSDLALTEMKQFKSFDGLSDFNKKYLAEHAVIRPYKKGDCLWQKGDPGDACALILEGLIEITTTNQDGGERIIGLFGPGEIVGLSAILKRTAYPATAAVSSPHVRILKMFIRSIEQELTEENNREMQTWLRERLLIHEQILRDKITILGAGKLHTKLIELFENLKGRFSTNSAKDSFLIPLPLTKTQIAKMIEARVETVIRVLNKWEKSGYLKMTEDGLHIKDLEKLRKMKEVS